MVTNVNIIVDDGGLLNRALTVQELNRQAMLDRLAEQKLDARAEAAFQQLQAEREGAIPEFDPQLRPAASVFPPGDQIAYAWMSGSTLFSGDRSASVEVPSIYPERYMRNPGYELSAPGVNYNWVGSTFVGSWVSFPISYASYTLRPSGDLAFNGEAPRIVWAYLQPPSNADPGWGGYRNYARSQSDSVIALPVGGAYCIVVVAQSAAAMRFAVKVDYDYDFQFATNVTEIVNDPWTGNFLKCYLVGPSSVREITPGAGLQSIFDANRATYAASSTASTLQNGAGVTNWTDRFMARTANGSGLFAHGAYSDSLSTAFGLSANVSADVIGTPTVFDTLDADLSAFEDADDSIDYSLWLAAFPPPEEFPSRIITPAPEISRPPEDDLPARVSYVRTASYRVPPYPATSSQDPDYPNDEGGIPSLMPRSITYNAEISASTKISAWDWKKPSYCKERLLALGFAAEDFIP
jgi:hypothetical protein